VPGTPITASTWSRTPPAETRPLRKLAARVHTSPRWKQCPSSSRLAPVTWAETQFSLTQADVNGTLVLDIGSSNANLRGHYYLNGVDLGRVWGIAQGGAPVQQYYYLPVDVVRSHQNRLTIVRQPTPAAACLPRASWCSCASQVLELGGSLDDLQIMRVSLTA
jgi:hypothetical protein